MEKIETENKYLGFSASDKVVGSFHPLPDITIYELAISTQVTILAMQIALTGQILTWGFFARYPPQILRHFDFYNQEKHFLTPLQNWAVEKSRENIEEIQKVFQKLHTPDTFSAAK